MVGYMISIPTGWEFFWVKFEITETAGVLKRSNYCFNLSFC